MVSGSGSVERALYSARWLPQWGCLALLCQLSLQPDVARSASKDEFTCTFVEDSKVQSPDGKWTAVALTRTCSDGDVVTLLHHIVALETRHVQPLERDYAIVYDASGTGGDYPQVVWRAKRSVRIVVPNLVLIGLVAHSVGDVRVTVCLNPARPDERARWLRSLGISDPLIERGVVE